MGPGSAIRANSRDLKSSGKQGDRAKLQQSCKLQQRPQEPRRRERAPSLNLGFAKELVESKAGGPRARSPESPPRRGKGIQLGLQTGIISPILPPLLPRSQGCVCVCVYTRGCVQEACSGDVPAADILGLPDCGGSLVPGLPLLVWGCVCQSGKEVRMRIGVVGESCWRPFCTP